jgi:DNA-binding transcriptional MerR regulator
MSSIPYRTPIYKLSAVVQRTGLKPDTLRAWERRYGLPRPSRTEGGHRVYSQRDVDIIRWLMARQEEGLNIKKAVDLWCQLEDEGRDPLPAPRVSDLSPPPALEGNTLSELRQDWVSACVEFNEERAEVVLAQAFALYPPDVVALDVLAEGLAQIGEGWYRGHVTVQQEHFASSLAMGRVHALVMACPPPTRPGHLLLACPPEESHAFSTLLLTFLLRREGWPVTHLGANVPIERLETTVEALRPQLVILAAQQLHTAATMLEMARFLAQARVSLGFGGGIFNELPAICRRIPGHFLGQSLKMAPQLVRRLLTAPQPEPEVEPVPQVYLQALTHFREVGPLIEADVWETLSPTPFSSQRLTMVNAAFALVIDAALALGDIGFADYQLEWVEDLRGPSGEPSRLLPVYLETYYQAAKAHLDQRGALVVDWLAERAAAETPGPDGEG